MLRPRDTQIDLPKLNRAEKQDQEQSQQKHRNVTQHNLGRKRGTIPALTDSEQNCSAILCVGE